MTVLAESIRLRESRFACASPGTLKMARKLSAAGLKTSGRIKLRRDCMNHDKYLLSLKTTEPRTISSVKLFCKGVPVSSNRQGTLISIRSRYFLDSEFFS